MNSAVRVTVILAFVALSAGLALLIARRSNSYNQHGGNGHVEEFEAAKRLVVVHATWCGHCKNLLEENGPWTKAKERLPGINVEEIDEADASDLVRTLNITGFPDIRILDGETTVAKFEGERTSDNIVAFALEHIK